MDGGACVVGGRWKYGGTGMRAAGKGSNASACVVSGLFERTPAGALTGLLPCRSSSPLWIDGGGLFSGSLPRSHRIYAEARGDGGGGEWDPG